MDGINAKIEPTIGTAESETVLFIENIVSENDENGAERGRGESPRTHIRRGRSYGLYDASGSPPDLI